ncbi:hypothetical protein KXQ82_17070 [Mucilaginibacter sp. HMF5004]|uniref:hypothetical protein n=1 Tax=Mucilaginibacter rivuli TaxID=2857527 RepID=UPI001C5F2329|nr:hypothetical protein [Mucilaginibacter rivuli]MBW4891442.1 hypothetical protein [Mucilaginibacter rivuli]
MKTFGYITCFFALLFLVGSCSKSDIDTANYFAFGSHYSFCAGNCSKVFAITGNKLVPVTFTDFNKPLALQTKALADSSYHKAVPLKETFPQYFRDHPNQTFGCPDCADQGGYYIEIMENGKKIYWRVDTSVGQLPVEIREYVTRLATVINSIH